MASPIKHMMRQGVAAMAIRFLSAGLGYALLIVLARWMEVDEFGHFGFAFSAGTTLAIVFGIGQRRLVLRYVAAYRGRGRADLLREVLRFSLAVTMLGIVISSLAVMAATALLGLHDSLYAAAAFAAVMIFSDFQSHVLRGLGSLVPALLPREVLWRPLTLGLMALAGGGLSIATNASVALWALTGVLFVLNATQFALVVRPCWRRALARIEETAVNDPNPGETLSEASERWRKSTMPLWGVSVLNQGLNPLSVVIVGLFVQPAETGAFFAAVRMATIIAFPLQALDLMAAPMLAKAYASGDYARVQHVANFTAMAAGITAFVGAGILIFFGAALLAMINPAYASANHVQVVVMSGFVVAALCGSSGYLMTMTGHDREFLWILGIWNGIGLVALTAFAALFGGTGAAWGLLVSKAGWSWPS